MSAHKPIHFPATREGALGAAKAFAPQMGFRYASERNRVVPGHPFVSCLSPAIRVRLICEREVMQIALEEFGSLQRCEKFVQEVNWRNYWRSWMELHPDVWRYYTKSRDERRANLSQEQQRRIQQLELGQSGCEPMDNFARELIETGYMHNHARMWFAAYWIHTERLPWQLGADFFDRHLVCSCPASNTLSWRWVAGLQTKGKSYLARRTNLEKYCDTDYLGAEEGIDRLRRTVAVMASEEPTFDAMTSDFQLEIRGVKGNVGLWITEDDLSPETCDELSSVRFNSICTSVMGAPSASVESNGLRRAYRLQAAQDAVLRAQEKWGVEGHSFEASEQSELIEQLVLWAKKEELRSVVALKPFVGAISSALESLRIRLMNEGIELQLLRRPEDAQALGYATGGFFKFWQGVKKEL